MPNSREARNCPNRYVLARWVPWNSACSRSIRRPLFPYHSQKAISSYKKKMASKICCSFPAVYDRLPLIVNAASNRYKLRDNTRAMAEMHNSFAHTIDNDVLSLLNENKQRIKAHLESLDSDLGTQADTVDKEREASTHALGEYGRSVQMVNSGNELGASQAAKSDPFVTHVGWSGSCARCLAQRRLEYTGHCRKATPASIGA